MAIVKQTPPCSPAALPTTHLAALTTTTQLCIPPCSRAGATGGQHCRSGAVLPFILASPVARTTMTLMSPLVTGVHHHKGLRRPQMRACARRAYCEKCWVNLGSKSSGWPNVHVFFIKYYSIYIYIPRPGVFLQGKGHQIFYR
jgi:hypothetical protein